MNDVAPEACVFSYGGLERAVLVVDLGRENERNVECPIARWKPEGIFGGVSEDVGSSLAKVCVLSSLSKSEIAIISEGSGTYEVHCVIMIPQQTSGLEVGVVVVLVLARECHILSPAIEGSSGRRAVKVDRVLDSGIVHEPDDGLGALWDNEGRAGRYSVVPYQLSRELVLVYLLLERLDLNLVVPDVIASDWIGDDPSFC